MNIQQKLKKFMGNKNTVTIIGAVLCVFVLFVGYNMRINSQLSPVTLPVAVETIPPRTLIGKSDIRMISVPSKFLSGDFYVEPKQIIGKYSNYNAMIPRGSLFYKELLIRAEDMPSAIYKDVPDGHTIVNYLVDMTSTYANSMEPGTYIDIYFKAVLDEDEYEKDPKVIFGKFVHNVKILAVKNSAGQNVFEATDEVREPTYLMFSVPTGIFELIKKAQYVSNEHGIQFTLVPNTVDVNEIGDIQLTSDDIREYIYDWTEKIDSNVIVESEDVYIKEEPKE